MINEELDRFAYVASHDLQEPLRKIMIFSDLMAAKLGNNADPEIQSSLSKITKASDRMQKLINDLLQFSRHTNSEADFREVDLNEIMEGVLSDVETELQKKNADVEVQKLPLVWGVPSQLQQLFQNIISNSLKFSRDGQVPKISIKSNVIKGATISAKDEKHKSNSYYQIRIQDNGIGFDPKYAEDIFVVFKRLHSYHEFEGTGIGLSICKKIVDKHNAYISAEGAPNEGAVFIISFPKQELINITAHQTVEKELVK